MTRLIALLVALAFALGAGTTPAWAQAPKEPAKPEQKAPPAAKKEPLNIKSASADELKTLKGIGEADATKIVENRPYKTTDDLIKKNVVSKATYDKIKDQIVANHFHLGSTPLHRAGVPSTERAERRSAYLPRSDASRAFRVSNPRGSRRRNRTKTDDNAMRSAPGHASGYSP